MGALEAGVKLLPFLQRALPDQSLSCLHKWIRSGQVRVNGRRSRAFDLLAEGDLVRLPPFARPLIFSGPKAPAQALPDLGPGLDIAFAEKDFLLLSKAGGLPAQGGSGHRDSVAARLAGAFAGAGHVPAPVHRLDRDTSGLLLAGRSMAAQKKLHHWLRSGLVLKDYLAWARGASAWTGPHLLLDRLAIREKTPGGREYTACLPGGRSLEAESSVARGLLKDFARSREEVGEEAGEKAGREAGKSPRRKNGRNAGEKFGQAVTHRAGQVTEGEAGPMAVQPHHAAFPGDPESGLSALCFALPVMTLDQAAAGLPEQGPVTLFLLRLVTGRKHQLRVQLASRGLPILGDRRYGPRFSGDFPLLLHAWRLILPPDEDPREYRLAPPWPAPFFPDAQALEAAACALDSLWI